MAESVRLVSELPQPMRDVIAAHERGEAHPGFEAAAREFQRRHILRLDDEPECWKRRTEMVERDPEVYRFMVGDAEFSLSPTSPFVGWDLRPRLGEITAPTLLGPASTTSRRPRSTRRRLHQGIHGSEWHLLDSWHSCQLEETSRTLVLVADFLARVDASG